MSETFNRWVASSLNRKFIAGTTAGLVAFSILFLILFVGMYRSQLQEERTDAAEQVNRLLQTSLEAAMLRRDLNMLRSIISQFGKQKNIVGVSIVNRIGDIRFTNHTELMDQHASIDCDSCDFDPATTTAPFSYFTKNLRGDSVLRTIHPVLNRTPCKECHGSADANPVNGSLVVDYDASSIQHHAGYTTLVLMGSGSIIVFVNLIGGWWFIRRYVLRPLGRLEKISLALANGNLDARVQIEGEDELNRLGGRFNQMAENLQQSLQKLKRNQLFLQGLIDANPDGIRVIDEEYNVILANQAYCRQVGVSNDQGTSIPCYLATHGRDTPCIPTLVSCPVREIREHGKPIKVLHQHTTESGQRIAVEVYAAAMELPDKESGASPRRLIVESIRDLEKEVQISHEQKLSEIGRLAAGVAHEIHNPLASVRLALDSATRFGHRDDIQVPEKIHDCMELVDREINRCIDVTERLLKLSMFAGGQTQIVSINQAVDETLSLLKWEAGEEGIETVQDLDSSNLRVIANESDVRIMVLNLVQNAFHSMPRGGTLTVTTRRREGQILMLFKDSGIGISIEEQLRIFDPFYSRRADGVEGTGLGLSITKTLVKRYGGSIQVDSTLDQGSLFTISLPDPDQQQE